MRLLARRGWGTMAACAVVAAASYYIGYAYGWMSEVLDYTMGVAFGIFGVTALVQLFPGHFDLRENGVARPGQLYWPWSQVRVVTWNREGTGLLVLARGWRRIAATVPLEQREAVERVIMEKSPTTGPPPARCVLGSRFRM